MFRALDQHRPRSARIVDDPYAELFLGPLYQAALRAGRIGGRFAPAIVTYIQARHRYIDEALVAALERGVEQVVIAGAGYDSRAYRFAEALAGRPVYELDFPSTSRRKAARVAAAGARLPRADVRRIEVDFTREGVAAALDRTDFRTGAPTFFVWEGVSMYLSRDAVKGALRSFRERASPASELAFDLWYLLDAPDLVSTAHRVTPNLFHLLGEPIVFGLHPEDLPDFLRREGLEALEVVETAELAARFVPDGRAVNPGVYVARAGFPDGGAS